MLVVMHVGCAARCDEASASNSVNTQCNRETAHSHQACLRCKCDMLEKFEYATVVLHVASLLQQQHCALHGSYRAERYASAAGLGGTSTSCSNLFQH